jgi:hypothetical protein
MKPLRILLLGLVGVALLLVVVVALAFTPAVQTWAAHKFAPATPALTVTLDRVAAGLGGAKVEGVRVVQPGLVLTLPSAEFELSVIDAAGGKVEVKKLVAKGWILDLTAKNGTPAATGTANKTATSKTTSTPSTAPASTKNPEAAAKEAFNGIFDLIQLPVDLAVDGVDLAGEVILPEGRAQVVITGGGLAAGKTGKFSLKTDVLASDGGTVALSGDITAGMNSPRAFDRFGFTATVTAKGPQLPAGAATDIALTAAREGQGEAYTVAVRSGTREVVAASIAVPAGTAPIIGSWSLDANTTDIAPFVLGQALPDFKAQGQGTFETDRTFVQIKTSGSLDASVDKLAAIQPEFAALGRLVLAAAFDVGVQGDVTSLNKLNVKVSGAHPVLTVVSLQPVVFNTRTGELTAADPSKQLVGITLEGLPLAWAKPFLGDLALTGDDVRGAFNVSARDGGFSVVPVAPVTLDNFSVSQAGKPLVRGLDVALTAQADYSPKGLTASVSDLSVRSGTATLLKASATAEKPSADGQPLTAKGAYEIDLHAALAQPVATGSASLSRGMARGDFDAVITDSTVANLTLQLTNLVAADAALTHLPSVAVQARVAIDAAGRIDANAPVLITQSGRRSDLTLGAIITPTTAGKNLNVNVTSESLSIPDLQLFAALAPAPAAESPAPRPTSQPPVKSAPGSTPASPAPVPTAPAWEGITGDVNIKLKKIVYTPQLQVNDFVGVIALTPSVAMLKDLHAMLNTGGKLNAVGGLTFDAKQKQPYSLKADLSVADVDAAPLLRALSPGEPSPVEGKFTVSTSLSGRAVEPAGITDTAFGVIIISSERGVLKALNVNATAFLDGTTAVSSGVQSVANVAGVFGEILGNKNLIKSAEKARSSTERYNVAADIAKQFAAIKYDKLNVIIGRDVKQNIDIKDITLVSPLVHLSGSGRITRIEGVSLLKQPLLINLKISARDEFADKLRFLKLITAQPDKTGYAPLVEDLTLDGTLQSIGTSQLTRLIKDTLLN